MKGETKAKIRILFFIGSLGTGGKERRLIELLGYLKEKDNYDLLVVTTKEGVELPKFTELNIRMVVLNDKTLISKMNFFFHLHSTVKRFKPHIIHTWGRMQTLYALPTVLITKTKLVNGQITSAPPKISTLDAIIDRFNFSISDVILSNSKAGIEVLNPPRNKARVIFNGIDLKRFEDLPDTSSVRTKYGIDTPYLILMVANFTNNKDFKLFFNLGRRVVTNRNDVTMMGVGYFEEDSELVKSCKEIIDGHPLLKIQPGTKEVESLINACDIGILFSNRAIHGEGISNSVIEYMALGKPVIANDAGGTKEIVITDKTGYLITNESLEQIHEKVNELLSRPDLRSCMGQNAKQMIQSEFSVKKMGSAFESLYSEITGQ